MKKILDKFAVADENMKISTTINNEFYAQTDFICDNASDIASANTSGSVMLNYPSGSRIFCLENESVYVLNAERSTYKELT